MDTIYPISVLHAHLQNRAQKNNRNRLAVSDSKRKYTEKEVQTMPNSSEKLTIAEFAARAGCTTQRIYQLLQNSLQPFAIVENGKKYILSDGLQVVFDARKKQGFTKSSETLAKSLPTLANSSEEPENDGLQQELDRIRTKLAQVTADRDAAREQRDKAEIRAAAAEAEKKRADAAEAQLSVKDQQIQQQSDRIADLTAALKAAQDQNKDLTAALKEQTTALTAAQALNAGTLQVLMQKAAPEPVTASQSADEPQGDTTPPPEPEPLRSSQDEREDAAAPSGSEPQQRKPGLFARIFRRERK